MLGFRWCTRFSLVAECGLLLAVASLVAEQGLWVRRDSGVVAHGLYSTGSVVVLSTCMGLAALQPVGSSWTRDGISVSGIGMQILYHWATRETPQFSLFTHSEYLLSR